MSTTPVPTPPRRNNAVWWILGSIGAGFLLLVVGGLLVAGFFLRGLRVEESGKRVDVQTPAGTITVEKTEAKDVGLPVYPGATPLESGANVELTTFEEQRVAITAARYTTPDPVARVDAWYGEKLGAEFEREEGSSGRGSILIGGKFHAGVTYVAEKHDVVRFVALSKRGSGTDIAVGRLGKQEVQ